MLYGISYWEWVSGMLIPIASIIYIVGVVKGHIIPTRMTWVIWTLLSGLTAATMSAKGILNVQIAVVYVGDIAVLFVAFRYGDEWEISITDKVCFGLSILALIPWVVTGDSLISLLGILATTLVAFWPMAKDLWQDSTIERSPVWIVMCISTICLTISLEEYTWVSLVQPMVYLLIPLMVLFLIHRCPPVRRQAL